MLLFLTVIKMGKNQHITPHPKGGWQVKGANNSRATVRKNTKAEENSQMGQNKNSQEAESRTFSSSSSAIEDILSHLL